MKLFIAWMEYESGVIGLYTSKEDAEAGAKKHLMGVYGDLDFLQFTNYDEFEMEMEAGSGH